MLLAAINIRERERQDTALSAQPLGLKGISTRLYGFLICDERHVNIPNRVVLAVQSLSWFTLL
jgi:hypothetical protein